MDPRLEQVFKRQGVPTFTFVPPNDFPGLKVALRTPGRGIVIEGPSGIGKTSAVRTALSELAQAGQLPYPDFLELSGRKIADDWPFIEALPEMKSFGMVIVDDFHRLPIETRERLANLLKTLADAEDSTSKLILIGINRAGEALIRLAPDLANRVDIFRFEANPPELVRRVFELGADALNIDFPDIDEMVAASFGSFYLAQMLGHFSCLGAGVDERQENKVVITRPLAEVKADIFETLDRSFYAPTRDFSRGRRSRPRGNAPYMRLLYWLSESGDWTISIPSRLNQEPEFRGSIGQIANKRHIETLINENEDMQRILSWDQESQVLSVEDPQYAFYLRNILWTKFPWRIGYRSVSFFPPHGTRYDVALSFAGADRDLARALFDELTERGLEVFYDENESARILAESVETYLAPIYESESKYVVPLMGPDYPDRVWARFESEKFSRRFGENAVIPVWFKNAKPQMFDRAREVGSLEFDPAQPLDQQVAKFADEIEQKLELVSLLPPEEAEIAEEVND